MLCAELKLSAGVGGFIGGDFCGGVEAGQKIETPYFGGGAAYAFFDATYAELNLAIYGGSGKVKPGDVDMSRMNFNIGLLGKYPFAMTDTLSLFPLLGIEYQICLSAKQGDNEFSDPGDLSALWFKLGGGGDFAFTPNIYLRGEALYGIRLANKFETDLKDSGGSDAKTLLGHGITVKLAVGYTF
ncbi:MAG: porin family protein [Treponema sp.]|nr:porin family protein [Treponema sp.]